jgi:hypothetical protein
MFKSPDDRIAELEAENARLQALNAALVHCMKKADVSTDLVSAMQHRYSFELSCKATTPMSTTPRSFMDLPGALLDRVDEYAGSDFFVRAAAEGDLPLMKFCMKAGVNMSGEGAVAAFCAAAGGDQAAAVRMLINARVKGLDAALIVAATKNNVDVVRILLGAGADTECSNSVGDTALTAAVPTGNATLIRSLLANGAKAGITNGNGLTPLGLAARGGHTAVADALLLSGADVNAINQPCDNTALMLAACMGHLGVVSRLLQAGADGSLRNANRLAAVDLATEGRHSAIVEMLYHWDVNTV